MADLWRCSPWQCPVDLPHNQKPTSCVGVRQTDWNSSQSITLALLTCKGSTSSGYFMVKKNRLVALSVSCCLFLSAWLTVHLPLSILCSVFLLQAGYQVACISTKYSWFNSKFLFNFMNKTYQDFILFFSHTVRLRWKKSFGLIGRVVNHFYSQEGCGNCNLAGNIFCNEKKLACITGDKLKRAKSLNQFSLSSCLNH